MAAKKNLILLKDQPSVELNGIVYSLSKGTIFKWVAGKKAYYLLSNKSRDDASISQRDLINNPDWYAETPKAPTYATLTVGGYVPVFKKGKVEIGCRTIKNSEIREVFKHLIS